MAIIKSFRDLDVYVLSREQARKIFVVSKSFPKEERFGLTSQVRRAAVSIAANVAEGAARTSTKEFLQFLSVSQGSASEADTELVIACRLGYLTKNEYEYFGRELDDIGRMITRLSQSLRRR